MQRTLVLLALSACTTSSPEELPDALTPPALDAAVVTTPIQGTVEDWSSTPIATATACVMGRADIACASTDLDGKYTLQMPPIDGNIAFQITAPDHLGFIDLENERQGFLVWQSGIPLRSTANATAFLGKAGMTYPAPGKGFLELRVTNASAGAIATISAPGAQGPIYLDATGVPDPSLTTTSTSGEVLFGNLSPGKVDVTVTYGGQICTVTEMGLPGAGDWAPTGDTASGGAVIAADAITGGINVECQKDINASH